MSTFETRSTAPQINLADAVAKDMAEQGLRFINLHYGDAGLARLKAQVDYIKVMDNVLCPGAIASGIEFQWFVHRHNLGEEQCEALGFFTFDFVTNQILSAAWKSAVRALP